MFSCPVEPPATCPCTVTWFPSCHGPCASFCTFASSVCSFAPLVSLRSQVVPLSVPGLLGFLPFVRGPQLLFQLLVPSIPHGEDLLSFQVLTCLIPISSFLFYHGDQSGVLQRVGVRIPRFVISNAGSFTFL